MSGPGKGRYTDFVGTSSPGPTSKFNRLHKLFNNNPMTVDKGESRGLFYGATDKTNQSSNSDAAASAVDVYVNSMVNDTEAVYTEDKKSLVYFNGNNVDPLPDTQLLSAEIPFKGIQSPPANAYIPDLSSPGASSDGKVNVTQKGLNILDPELVKPDLVIPTSAQDHQNLGTLSPSNSAPIVGKLSIGSNLKLGDSNKT